MENVQKAINNAIVLNIDREKKFLAGKTVHNVFPRENLFEMMFTQSTIGTMIFDEEGECIKYNKKMQEIFGIEPSLISGDIRYNILKDPAFDRSTMENIVNLFNNHRPLQREIIYNFKKSLIFLQNGINFRTPRWYNLRAYPIIQDGVLKYVVSHFEDITAKKETERSLLQHSRELQILNNLIITANSTDDVEELLKDIVGYIISNLSFSTGTVYFTDHKRSVAAIKYSTRTDDEYCDNFRFLDINKHPYKEVFVNGSPLFFENYGMLSPELSVKFGIKGFAMIPFSFQEEISGAIMISGSNKHWFTDLEKKVLNSVGQEVGTVIERIKYANALRNNEKRYKNIFNNSALGIYQLDPDGTLQAVNNAFARLFRLDSQEEALALINKSGNKIFLSKRKLRQMFKKVEKSGNSVYKFEKELFKKDKSTFIGKIILQSVKNERGETDYFEGFIEDVTERKRTEARMRILNYDLERRVRDRTILLQATNNELESFAYSVSHDLREPLRAIDGFSLALLEEYDGSLDDKGKDYLNRVRTAGKRMNELIDDLLKLSKVTRADMDKQIFSLSDMVAGIFASLGASNANKNINTVLHPGLDIKADRSLLRIALENLAGNAFKFSGKKTNPVIAFGSEIIDGKRAYYIKDNGAGFDMKYAGKLFGAFQRFHRAEEFPGTGIGLATVKRIIHMHGGNVWAESEPGKGAVFYFTLGEE